MGDKAYILPAWYKSEIGSVYSPAFCVFDFQTWLSSFKWDGHYPLFYILWLSLILAGQLAIPGG